MCGGVYSAQRQTTTQIFIRFSVLVLGICLGLNIGLWQCKCTIKVIVVNDSVQLIHFFPPDEKSIDTYDPLHRNPVYCRAEKACVWELRKLQHHYHPSVGLFASTVLKVQRSPLWALLSSYLSPINTHCINHFIGRPRSFFVNISLERKAAAKRRLFCKILWDFSLRWKQD